MTPRSPARTACACTQDEVGDMHLLGSCCGRMFRRASLVQLFLDEDLFYGEDTLFSVCNFYGSKGMRLLVLGCVPVPIYARTSRNGYITAV